MITSSRLLRLFYGVVLLNTLKGALYGADATGGTKISFSGGMMFNAFAGSEDNRDTIKIIKGNQGLQNATASTNHDQKGGHAFSLDKASLGVKASRDIDYATFNRWVFNMILSGDRSAKTIYMVPQIYLTFLSPYTTLTLGNYSGVEDSMAFGGGSLLGGTGGFGGYGHRSFVNITSGCGKKVELVGDGSDATKLTVVSPRLWGVQLGLSYTPNTANVGRRNRNDTSNLSGDEIFYRNFLAFGLNFVDFVSDDVKLSLSLTAVTGKALPADKVNANVGFYNAQGWATGMVIDIGSWGIGYEYGTQGRTGMIRGDFAGVVPPSVNGVTFAARDYQSKRATGQNFVDAALSYLFESNIKVAAGYYHSWRRTGFKRGGSDIKATSHIWNASVTHQPSSGLQIYLEGFLHNCKNPAAVYEQAHILARLASKKDVSVVGDQKAKTIVLGLRATF